MRYDKTVSFIISGEEFYNDTTGDYEAQPETRIERSANITDTGTETMNMLYGKVKQDAKTVRILGKMEPDFSYIEIGGVAYSPTLTRILRNETVYHVVKKQ